MKELIENIFIIIGIVITISVIIAIVVIRKRKINNQIALKIKQSQQEPILNNLQNQPTNENIDIQKIEIYPYHKKYLLTKNEYYFYKKLKTITDKYNLQILTKIRLADLVEVDSKMTKSEWGFYFNKIKAKHIDFIIVDEMKVVLLIELDDNSHSIQNKTNRDDFVNKVVSHAGYGIVRTYGDTNCINNILFEYRNKQYV